MPLAAQFPDRVDRWAVMDAPFPGLGTWEQQLLNPRVWHFNFRGPDVERLVAGRERILLDRFYNELSANPAGIDEQTRRHYAALYARPGAIHNAFSGQFAAFSKDAEENKALFAEGRKTPHAGVGDRRRSFLRCCDADRGRSNREQRPRGCHCQLRALDHGRAAAAGNRADHRILEEGAVSMDRLRHKPLLCVMSLLALSVLATAQEQPGEETSDTEGDRGAASGAPAPGRRV